MLNDILAYAAGFPRWYNVQVEEFRPIPGWSLFYDECRLCNQPVLAIKEWREVHWKHHVLAGDIKLDPNLKPGERKLVYA